MRTQTFSPFVLRSARFVLRSALFSACLLTTASVFAQLPVTELHTVFPPGGKAGATFDVRTAGANQEEANRLVFSHPGIQAQVKSVPVNEFLTDQQPQSGQFQVTIAADVPPGLYDAWLIGRFGVSNCRTFAVGLRDEWNDDGTNHKVDTAKEIALGTTVNGTAEANEYDYYRVSLAAGQHLLAECWARTIDSSMNASIAVLDANGRELARTLDTDGADPVLDFTAPAEGQYIIAVWDFYFEGGANRFYRLQVHNDPRIDFVFPPAGQPGTAATFTAYGRNLPEGKPAPGITLEGVPLQQQTVTLNLPADSNTLQVANTLQPQSVFLDAVPFTIGQSLPALVGLAKAPVVVESEPNNSPQQPQAISVPAEIAGQFYPARDVDCYQFQAKKNDVLVIDVQSHRLSLGTDPFLQIDRIAQDAEGKTTTTVVAQVDDPPERPNLIGSAFDVSTDDPSYRFVAPEDGTYRITVFDQFGDSRSDPRMVYRLAIRPEQPDFKLYAFPEEIKVASPDAIPFHSLVLRRGGTAVLKVSGTRIDGFADDIQLTVEGLPAGITCAGGILSVQTPTVWLVFEAAEDAAEWAGPIRVIGKAVTATGEIVRQARAGTVVWGTANRQAQRPDFRVARDLYLSVIPETIPALVRVGEPQVYETSIGGTIELPIQLTRRAGFAEALKLIATNVPNELKPADVDIPGDQSAGKLTINAANPNFVGAYDFYLRADSKLSYQRNPEAVARAEGRRDKQVEILNQLTAQLTQVTAERDAAVQKATEAAQVNATAQQTKAAADAALQQATTAAQQAAAALEAAKQNAANQPNDQAAKDTLAAAEQQAQAAEQARVAAETAAQQAAQAATDAQAAQQAADEAKAKAEQVVAEADAKVKRATEAKTALDQAVEAAKTASNPAELQIALVSTPIQLRIVRTPIYLNAAQPQITVKRTEKADLAVQLERRYGFAAPVELTLEGNGVAGLAAEKIDVAADQGQGALAVAATEATPVGRHNVIVKAKGKFNNVDVQAELPVVVEVVE